MEFISQISELDTLYDQPPEASIVKVAGQMTPLYRKWIMRSRFCILTTVGPEGTDSSPRGDEGPVVLELDPHTLAMPDWRGNNRIDSLRNIVVDGRVSMMFMVPGSANVIRLNGQAKLTCDPEITTRFEVEGRNPKTVIIIAIGEIYAQCARAVIRADLWSGKDNSEGLPSMGDILREMTQGDFNGANYDANWGARAARTLW